ncbi:uncharacterized protein LOC108086295 [Drosophila ficusphila]|uniref:uncharacterized protein LOC108086295 n=1 Tax=Drosophila ficusphila TaxID=30025 RepID=UPI0007E8A2FF|nr:uncharacterized protein LOC108086295 [Drosophila ficusphila]
MSSSGIVLYGADLSPCVRTVKLTLKALNLDYEYKEVNLQAGEHLSEDFLKKNPQHTVPVLDDNGTFLWDSHAIITYLVDKYGKSDELYPKDLVKRAIINQRLFFDASVIFAGLANVSGPFWISGITEVPQEKLDTIHRGLKLLETFLGNNPYLAGDSLTLADLSAGATVSALPAAVDIDSVEYPKITAWRERLNQIPYFKEINEAPAQAYVDFLRSKWTKLGDKKQTVKLTLKALNLEYEYKEVNLQAGEHLSKDYLEKNPQHTVPVLDDNGIILWDSHAIATYLVDKYGKSDELYPKDLVKRALINQRLFFEASVTFPGLYNIARPFWFEGVTEVPQEKLDTVHRGLKLLESFLASSSYLVGESLTLADLTAGPTVSGLRAVVDIESAVYPKITAWLDRLNQIPFYKEINEGPVQEYVAFLRSKWTKLGDKINSGNMLVVIESPPVYLHIMSNTGIILYGTDWSPCVRTVQLTLKALNLDYVYKEVNLQAGEHLSKEYLEKNPQHTVPVLDDNGIILWDSHAIAIYLVDKYGKSDELYPKDLAKRAIVNQRLFFEASVSYPGLSNIVRPFWFGGVTEVPQEKLDTVHRGLKLLESFLASSSYLVGESLTLADLAVGPTVSGLRAAVDIEPAEYPKITAWLDRLNQIPFYKEINEGPVQGYVAFLRSKWTKLGA